jgi:hypothetical protein
MERAAPRLLARIRIAVGLSLVVDFTCAALLSNVESELKGSDLHGYWDSWFFSTVQVLTIILVVTAVAGSFASFFSSADQS